jgi:hypothetical protein
VDTAVIVYALHLAPFSTKRQTKHLCAASAGTGDACQAGAHMQPTSHTKSSNPRQALYVNNNILLRQCSPGSLQLPQSYTTHQRHQQRNALHLT